MFAIFDKRYFVSDASITMIDLILFLFFVWQVFWTDRPCKNFHLLICLAILDTEKSTLMENKFGLTEILKVSFFIHILFTSSITLTIGANLFLVCYDIEIY